MEPFPVTRIAHISSQHSSPAWLVDALWGEQAVGFIGGTPKTGKTWLALELAVAVASGRPCLGHFQVRARGHVLLYAAEDNAAAIKHRVCCIAKARGVSVERMPVGLITAPALHLDDPDHQERLEQTLARIRPRMLVLDPLVRLHCGDENSASDVSELLAFLRALQRKHALAIAVVHHIRKSATGQPGQALRGSGDLHAWSDSSLYLLRRQGRIELHGEHRSHPSPAPRVIELADEPALHLALRGPADDSLDQTPAASTPLAARIIECLTATPMKQADLRDHLRVRNEALGHALATLEATGQLRRSDGMLAIPDSHP